MGKWLLTVHLCMRRYFTVATPSAVLQIITDRKHTQKESESRLALRRSPSLKVQISLPNLWQFLSQERHWKRNFSTRKLLISLATVCHPPVVFRRQFGVRAHCPLAPPVQWHIASTSCTRKNNFPGWAWQAANGWHWQTLESPTFRDEYEDGVFKPWLDLEKVTEDQISTGNGAPCTQAQVWKNQDNNSEGKKKKWVRSRKP